ncbi:MAG: hypothetical protein SPJ63_00835 [Oscillospiraceae bacterium]|nr:hypothetical protein [Oscillospiraceae bacterium]
MKLISTKSSRSGKSSHTAKKASALTIAIILILVMAIGGTVAFLVTHTDQIVNTFQPTDVTCEINEDFNEDNTVKTSAVVENTGKIPAYIRVAVVANTVDADGNITGAADISKKLASSGWTKIDGYYYYNGVVRPNETTGQLLGAEGIDLNGIQVTILASAIQAEPDSAVAQAWGVKFDGSTWSAVSGT